MNCLQAQELVNAAMDGEILSQDQAALDEHLAVCPQCQEASEQLHRQDALLRAGLAPMRDAASALAERVAQQVTTSPPGTAVASTRAWSWLGALAAGFFLAAIVFQPWKKPREIVVERLIRLPAAEAHAPQSASQPPLIQLAVATGPVEVLPASKLEWFACPTSGAVDAESSIRTGPLARCEFATADGAQLRMNNNTEIRLSGNQVELSKGQVCSSVRPGQSPVEVKTADATVSAQDGQFELARNNGEAVLTVIQGQAIVRDRQGEQTIDAGNRATLSQGKVAAVRRVSDPVLETSWMHEVLALKGGGDPEYMQRMQALLAQIGQAKLSILYEEEIRRQGDSCVAPLVEFIRSTLPDDEVTKRRRAARIVADVAQPRSIPELVLLLSDEDAFVRRSAAEGLLRLTNRDQGRPPQQWQTESATACEPTVKQWQSWLDQERGRIPGLPRAKETPKGMKKI